MKCKVEVEEMQSGSSWFFDWMMQLSHTLTSDKINYI
jgi:hypothetical protein